MKSNVNRKHKAEVIYAFIDSQNLNLGIKSLGWKLDFRKFRFHLKSKYHANKAFLFIGYVKDNQKLYKYLEKAGYILIFKPTLQYSSKKKRIIKGNVDAELVLHTMIQLPKFDKAIIISGDGDFFCLIEYLNSINKFLKIITPNRKYSALLRSQADKIVSLDRFKNSIGIKN